MNSNRDNNDKLKLSSTGKIYDALSVDSSEIEANVQIQFNNVDEDASITSSSAKNPLDSIDIPVELQNKGKIKVNVYQKDDHDDKSNSVDVKIIYTPENGLIETGPLFLSYRDDKGFGHIIEMNPAENGSWSASREMLPSESSELGIHRVDPRELSAPPDFSSPDHFKTQVPLIDSRIISEIFPNPTLAKKDKAGTLQRRIFRSDNTLSEPLGEDENPKLSEGQEIVHIYLPHGYKQSATEGLKYPVIVMLDGDMHIDTDPYGNSLGTPNILDNLIVEERMEPSIVIFSAPTPPTNEGTPRLREYGCSSETALRLSLLPKASELAGLPVKCDGVCITGASMGGIQAIYTAKIHPDVFDKVIAQSPALWWEPPVTLSGDKFHVEYDRAETWRKDPDEKFHVDFSSLSTEQKNHMDEVSYKGFIYDMFATGKDVRTEKVLPEGKVEIVLQVGSNETGTIHPIVGKEPLTQATKTLARDFNTPLRILDGPHSPHIWASGLCEALPQICPCVKEKPKYSL